MRYPNTNDAAPNVPSVGSAAAYMIRKFHAKHRKKPPVPGSASSTKNAPLEGRRARPAKSRKTSDTPKQVATKNSLRKKKPAIPLENTD